jgi:hypothetical protein
MPWYVEFVARMKEMKIVQKFSKKTEETNINCET